MFYFATALTIMTELLHSAQQLHVMLNSIFVERWVGSSALLTFLVGWHPIAVSLPPGDEILAQLPSPLNDIIFFV
jgi:hypothetical protein